MALSDEWQLQIYIIIGVVSFFLLALILAVSLLTYYVVKLYKERRDENSYLRRHNVESGNAYKNNVYSNSALDLDDELNRRYTMHRSIEEPPQPPSLRSFGTIESIEVKGTAAKNKSNNNVVKSKPSVIDVSEEFRWRNLDGSSKYNSSIMMHVQQEEETFNSKHEGRTAFND